MDVLRTILIVATLDSQVSGPGKPTCSGTDADPGECAEACGGEGKEVEPLLGPAAEMSWVNGTSSHSASHCCTFTALTARTSLIVDTD